MPDDLDYERVRDRAREICEEAGLEPDFFAIVGNDNFGTTREPNWMLFEDEAREQLLAEGGGAAEP